MKLYVFRYKILHSIQENMILILNKYQIQTNNLASYIQLLQRIYINYQLLSNKKFKQMQNTEVLQFKESLSKSEDITTKQSLALNKLQYWGEQQESCQSQCSFENLCNEHADYIKQTYEKYVFKCVRGEFNNQYQISEKLSNQNSLKEILKHLRISKLFNQKDIESFAKLFKQYKLIKKTLINIYCLFALQQFKEIAYAIYQASKRYSLYQNELKNKKMPIKHFCRCYDLDYLQNQCQQGCQSPNIAENQLLFEADRVSENLSRQIFNKLQIKIINLRQKNSNDQTQYNFAEFMKKLVRTVFLICQNIYILEKQFEQTSEFLGSSPRKMFNFNNQFCL